MNTWSKPKKPVLSDEDKRTALLTHGWVPSENGMWINKTGRGKREISICTAYKHLESESTFFDRSHSEVESLEQMKARLRAQDESRVL